MAAGSCILQGGTRTVGCGCEALGFRGEQWALNCSELSLKSKLAVGQLLLRDCIRRVVCCRLLGGRTGGLTSYGIKALPGWRVEGPLERCRCGSRLVDPGLIFIL